jgi:plastocyanin domain-containing protein
MNSKAYLLAVAAAIGVASATALAQQHDHGAMQHGSMQHGAQPASAAQGIAEGTLKHGVRTVEVAVTDNGFEPSKVKANKGEKVRFVVTRKTDGTCAKEIVIKEAGINQPLPLGKAVTVEFTPKKSGEIRYACGMDHVSGVVFVP